MINIDFIRVSIQIQSMEWCVCDCSSCVHHHYRVDILLWSLIELCVEHLNRRWQL